MRISWRMIKTRFNCYNLSAIFMNNPRYNVLGKKNQYLYKYRYLIF